MRKRMGHLTFLHRHYNFATKSLASALLLAIGSLVSLPILRGDFYDDAYIHLRIARNFEMSGRAFFIEENSTKIDSSTGWVFLVRFLQEFMEPTIAVRSLLYVTTVLTIFGLGVIAYFYYRSFRSFYGVLVFAAVPYLLLAAYGGMETPLFCLAVVLAAIFWFRGRMFLTLLVLASTTWIRFEAILLALLAMFVFLLRPNVRRQALVLASLPIVLLGIVEMLMFGTMIPHATKAKRQGYGYSLSDSIENIVFNGFSSKRIGILILIFAMIVIVNLILNHKHLDFSRALLVFSLLVFGMWAISRSLLFQWYYCLFTTPLVIGLVTSRVQVTTLSRSYLRIAQKLCGALLAVTTALVGVMAVQSKLDTSRDPAQLRIDKYLEIGAALYKECPGCSLLTSEIGALGFTFQGKVLDGFGLGDERATKYHPLTIPYERSSHVGAIAPEYAELMEPDFIVTLPVFAESIAASTWISEFRKYECPIARDPNVTIWGDSAIAVYSREELSEPILTEMNCRL